MAVISGVVWKLCTTFSNSRLCSHMTTSQLIQTHTQISREHLTPEIGLHLITQSCKLWTANADETPVKDPFWAFYWPGGQAVSRYLLDNPQIVAGRRVLDIGSGSGACAIAAAKATSSYVTANDIDPVAAVAISLNAALNRVSLEVSTLNLVGSSCTGYDCLLLGDMFYDSDFADQLLSWLKTLCERGKVILVGDPGRHAFKELGDLHLTCVARYKLPKNVCLENSGFNEACVWKFVM